MNPKPIVHARPPLAAVIDLLNRAHLPTQDLTEAHCEHFYFSGTTRELTGLVGLERQPMERAAGGSGSLHRGGSEPERRNDS